MSAAAGFVALRGKFNESMLVCLEVSKGRTEIEMSPLKASYAVLDSLTETEKKVAMDQAFRDVLNLLIKSKETSKTKQESFSQLMELVIESVQQDMCSPLCPFLMMSDIFDTSTLQECEPFFHFVEKHVSTWKNHIFFDKGKNYLLRMCNDLLRRLSRSQNTIFCGRIQLFLAHLFPLEEKSGLNLVSQFNVDNRTTYNTKSEVFPTRKKSEGEVGSEDGDSGEVKDDVKPATVDQIVDYALYRKFWSLQDFFNKPVKLFDKSAWKMFSSNLSAVIKVFESYKLDDVKFQKAPLTGTEDVYFAKYLTNEKLLDLQLNDTTFRRNILLQLLIVFQYLNAPVKFKTPALILTEEQNSSVKELTEKVYNLLKETPPDGEQFAEVVKHILSREEFWNNWKNEGCPPFAKPRINAAVPVIKKPRKKPMGEDIVEGDGTIKMGAAELTRLWNLEPDNLKACASDKRIFLPFLETFLEEAVEQADPAAQIEDEFKKINDQGWCWRALRLLARKSHHFWAPPTNQNQQNAKKLSQGLETMILKVAKEFPSTQQTNGDGEEKIKEEGELDEDGSADGSTAVHGGGDEDDEEELLKSGKNEGNSWMEKEITLEILQTIANKADRKLYRKLGHELNFGEDDMAAFESDGGTSEEHCIKMLKTWIEEEGEKATFPALINALMGVPGLKSLVALLKEGGEGEEDVKVSKRPLSEVLEEEDKQMIKKKMKKEREDDD